MSGILVAADKIDKDDVQTVSMTEEEGFEVKNYFRIYFKII